MPVKFRSFSAIVLFLILGLIPCIPFADPLESSKFILVSISFDGKASNDKSYNPVISADGRYVAFQSPSNNITPRDLNKNGDVFVRDLVNGTTKLVSGTELGAIGNKNSDNPSISSDGRFIAFRSGASNLVADDNNGLRDIFVYDQLTSQTKRVSVSSTGEEANGQSFDPTTSPDGSYVVFFSHATNLAETSGSIFVHDLLTGETTGLGIFGYCYVCSNSISADGRYVTFGSVEKLTNQDTSSEGDIFVYDLKTNEIVYVSIPFNGLQMNRESDIPSISGNGRFVSFVSEAPNMIEKDDNGDKNSIFVRDLMEGTTELVSINDVGEGITPSRLTGGSISGDGRFIAFSDDKSIFVHDRKTATTTSLNVTGKVVSISADGKFVAFDTKESLVEQDTNGVFDVYVTKFNPPEPKLERELSIPGWIKFNAKFWSNGEIDNSSFLNGIEWLITNDIMIISEPETMFSKSKSSQEIPGWIKNNASWWADGSISDRDFVQGIGWLISAGILRI